MAHKRPKICYIQCSTVKCKSCKHANSSYVLCTCVWQGWWKVQNLGAQHYKLSISLSICISVVEALEARPPPHHHHPVPPALMYIKENAKAKAKKQNLYNPCPSIIHYVSHVCGTLDLQILVVALQKKIQGQSLRHVLLKIKKKV